MEKRIRLYLYILNAASTLIVLSATGAAIYYDVPMSLVYIVALIVSFIGKWLARLIDPAGLATPPTKNEKTILYVVQGGVLTLFILFALIAPLFSFNTDLAMLIYMPALFAVFITRDRLKGIRDYEKYIESQKSKPKPASTDLNTCIADNLLVVPYMTRTIVEHIILARDRNGHFQSVEELEGLVEMPAELRNMLKRHFTIEEKQGAN